MHNSTKLALILLLVGYLGPLSAMKKKWKNINAVMPVTSIPVYDDWGSGQVCIGLDLIDEKTVFVANVDGIVKIKLDEKKQPEKVYGYSSRYLQNIVVKGGRLFYVAYQVPYEVRVASKGQYTIFPYKKDLTMPLYSVMQIMVKGGRLFAYFDGGTIRGWDIKTTKCIHKCSVFGGAATRMVLQDDRLFVATTGGEVCEYKLNLKSQKEPDEAIEPCKDFILEDDHSFRDMAMTKHTIYLACEDDVVLMYKKIHGKWGRSHVFKGHTGAVINILLDGERLFTSSEDKTIRVWNTKNKRCLQVFRGCECAMGMKMLSPKSLIAVCWKKKAVLVWDIPYKYSVQDIPSIVGKRLSDVIIYHPGEE